MSAPMATDTHFSMSAAVVCFCMASAAVLCNSGSSVYALALSGSAAASSAVSWASRFVASGDRAVGVDLVLRERRGLSRLWISKARFRRDPVVFRCIWPPGSSRRAGCSVGCPFSLIVPTQRR